MARPRNLQAPDQIGPDTPLRLDVAAAIAYPDGSMTASGLRKERDRGRLVVEKTAGKEYTTLAAIARMRELCRITGRPGAAPPPPPPADRVDTERARLALEGMLAELRAKKH